MDTFGKLAAITGIALCALPLPFILFQYLGAVGSADVALGSILSDANIAPYLLWGAALYLVGFGTLKAQGCAARPYFLLGVALSYAPMLSPNWYPFLIATALLLTTWSCVAVFQIARTVRRSSQHAY